MYNRYNNNGNNGDSYNSRYNNRYDNNSSRYSGNNNRQDNNSNRYSRNNNGYDNNSRYDNNGYNDNSRYDNNGYNDNSNGANSSHSFENNPKLKNIDPLKIKIIMEIKEKSKYKSMEELLPEMMKINQELNRRQMGFTKNESELLLDAIEESLSPAEKQKFQMIKSFMSIS